MKQSKVFLIVFLAIVAVMPDVRAEDGSNKTRLVAGLKLGVNLSKLDGQSWDGGYKTNMLGGAYLALNGNRFGVQLEGLFSQTTYTTGNSFNDIYHQYLEAGQDSLSNGRFRFNYFNIPLVFQLRILGRGWLQLGPQFSGSVSVKDLDNFVKDAQSLFATGTVSMVTGLHIDVTRHINIGARYVMGLTDLEESGFESWKQRDIQLHLGYRF